jgi:flagellar hook-associated protein 1 FlgK
MADAIRTLLSRINVDKERLQVSSSNIARHNVDGNTRKELQVASQASNGELTGVQSTGITRVVNNVLQSRLRLQSSSVGNSEVLNDYYSQLQQLFGSKGEQNSFVHDISRFADSLKSLAVTSDPGKKREVVLAADQMLKQLNWMTQQMQVIRTAVDSQAAEITKTVNTQINDIQSLNVQITQYGLSGVDTTALMDQRELLVYQLAENMDIFVQQTSPWKISLFTGSGQTLLQETIPSTLSYTQAPTTSPGQTLSPVTLNGIDVTNQIASGQLQALINMRDTVIPGLQSQLDELARQMRDSLNAIHNQGSPALPRNQLTSMSLAPGLPSITGTSVISGNGTLRIGVVDPSGTLIDYKDIVLSANMTINSLISQINSTSLTTNATGGTFSAALVNGTLQITAGTGANGIVLGSAGTPAAQICAGTTFNTTNAYGFSHFFGFNNLFQTGNIVATSSLQPGVANIIGVRQDILANPNLLSCGQLSSSTPPPLQAGAGIPVRDISITQQMSAALKTGQISFSASGNLPLTVTNFIDYGSRILSANATEATAAHNKNERERTILEELSSKSNEISAVDPSTELMNTITISSSQAITMKAMKIMFENEKMLLSLFGG